MGQRRSRAGIVLAMCGAMLIHAQLCAGLWIWDRLHPPEGANDVDVEYVDANEANLDKTQLPLERIQLPPPPDQDLRIRTPKKPQLKKEELANRMPVEPQRPQDVQLPKPPEEKPKPNQPPPPTYHQKMVEQEYEKDEADNPNAK